MVLAEQSALSLSESRVSRSYHPSGPLLMLTDVLVRTDSRRASRGMAAVSACADLSRWGEASLRAGSKARVVAQSASPGLDRHSLPSTSPSRPSWTCQISRCQLSSLSLLPSTRSRQTTSLEHAVAKGGQDRLVRRARPVPRARARLQAAGESGKDEQEEWGTRSERRAQGERKQQW